MYVANTVAFAHKNAISLYYITLSLSKVTDFSAIYYGGAKHCLH